MDAYETLKKVFEIKKIESPPESYKFNKIELYGMFQILNYMSEMWDRMKHGRSKYKATDKWIDEIIDNEIILKGVELHCHKMLKAFISKNKDYLYIECKPYSPEEREVISDETYFIGIKIKGKIK